LIWALLLVILATGCGGSGSSDPAAAAAAAQSIESGPTEAALHPVGDGEAQGRIVYVKKPPRGGLLKIRLKGLEPISGEKQYVVWLMSARDDMVCLATYYVGRDEKLFANLEPNPIHLRTLEDGSKTQVLITKVNSDDRLREAIDEAPDAYNPTLIGDPLLRGVMSGPLVDATEG